MDEQRLAEIKARRCYRPKPDPDIEWLVGEVERLQRFEAMWEDCCQHRDQVERRARRYMEIVQQVEKLVVPEEPEP